MRIREGFKSPESFQLFIRKSKAFSSEGILLVMNVMIKSSDTLYSFGEIINEGRFLFEERSVNGKFTSIISHLLQIIVDFIRFIIPFFK